MNNKIKLSIEEQAILHKLNNDQLRFLVEIDENSKKERLVEVLNLLINREKDVFFQENGLKLDPEKLYALHAFSRGSVTAYVTLFHLLKGAKLELVKRNDKKENT